MRRKYKKILIGALLLIMCIGLFPACGGVERLKPFKTELTAEDHIARIAERTEEKYAEELDNGAITAFQVYTLWSFKEKPEYFLIEFDGDFYEYYVEGQGYNIFTGYAFLIGFIVGDQYFYYAWYPRENKSPFREQDIESEKKYYGFGVMAIKKDEGMICVGTNGGVGKEKFGTIVSKRRQDYLARHDYRLNSRIY